MGWNVTYNNKSGLLEQQPAIERLDRYGYSVMLKLFRSGERDDEVTAETEFVATLCQAAKLPLPCFCIAEGCRNLNGLSYIEPLFDNEVTLRFILEKAEPLSFICASAYRKTFKVKVVIDHV